MGDSPDWLPAGWKVKVRVRRNGKRDKFYVDTSNKLKFNSKPEVLRYLKEGEVEHSKHKEPKKAGASKNSSDPGFMQHVGPISRWQTHSNLKYSWVDIKKTVAEELPPGWIKEIRIRRQGGKTRRDPSYIDPITGRHFRSMAEVFRYLETKDQEKSHPIKGKDHITEELADRSVSTRVSKRRRLHGKKEDKNANKDQISNTGSKDAAVENDEGSDVSHSGQTEKEDDIVAEDFANKLSLVEGTKQNQETMIGVQKLAEEANENVHGNQSLESVSKGASVNNVGSPKGNRLERIEKEDCLSGDSRGKSMLVNGMEQNENGRSQNNGSTDNKVVKNWEENTKSEAAVLNIDKTAPNHLEQIENKEDECATEDIPHKCENSTGRNKKKKTNSKLVDDFPRRTSQRLAAMEVNASPETKTCDQARGGAGVEVKAEDNAIDNSSPPAKKVKTENSTKDKKKDSAVLPLPDLSPPKKHIQHMDVDLKGGKKQKTSIDSPFNDILNDPCIDFAIKTLTGAIPIEEVIKVSSSPVSSLASPNAISAPSLHLPPGDLWSDPCFEFAVKTLTSETPPMTNTFHQTYSLSETKRHNILVPSNFRIDNFKLPSRAFTLTDRTGKPYVSQEAVKAPPNAMSWK